jgi:hypothetical protein
MCVIFSFLSFLVIERQFTSFPGARVSAGARHDRACAPRAGPGQAGPGGVQVLAGALDDQLALELIDRAEDVEGQPPGRRGRVDLLLKDDQADAALAQLVGEREQVLERPHRAGQAGDDEHDFRQSLCVKRAARHL